jgi:hypothetical protein
MGNGSKPSRNLEYRLTKGDLVEYKVDDKVWEATYTGQGNMLEHNKCKMSINQLCRSARKGKKYTNINVWITKFKITKNSGETLEMLEMKLKDIHILPKYKEWETHILNDDENIHLKLSNINNINNNNNNMPRGRPRKNANVLIKAQMKSKAKSKVKSKVKSNAKPLISKELEETARRLREYETETSKWWDSQQKGMIEDLDYYTKVIFAQRKLKGHDNVYEMLNQNKQKLGIIHPWVDKTNQYPTQFKNNENVVTPMGIPEYEYILEKDCPFHDMPRSTYYKYTFTKVFKKFILTDEICEFKED